MINYHNIVFPFLHRHGCRQEADSNFRDFARTSQIKSSIRQSPSLRINNLYSPYSCHSTTQEYFSFNPSKLIPVK